MASTDRYELVRQLGRGASGEVYLARDRLHGGREVALKTIRARVDELLRAAFEREFATLAALSVPGVAPVFDFGLITEPGSQTARPFFTRSFIDGQPLDEACAALDLRGRLSAFLRLAAVLAPLHRAGVIHGDIKPGNSIVDPQGQVWLIDFGLAQSHGQARERDALNGVGTPSFMAPELLRGEAPTQAADIYALGVTLWRLVTGEYPYASFGPRAVSARLEGKLPEIPVTADALTRGALEVALRALARAPLDRFPSVDELSSALRRLANDKQAPTVPGERAFIPPRPRGHADLIATLEALATAHQKQLQGGESKVLLVTAPPGGGKSLLLRELKWRLQLRAHTVFEVFAGRGSVSAPLLALIEQLLVVLGREHVAAKNALALADEVRTGKLDEARTSSVLAELLSAAARETSIVLCVDDLDGAEAVLGAVLRSAVHADMPRGVLMIATASVVDAPAVKGIAPERSLQIPPLSREDVAALTSDALGPLDATAIEALSEHAQGSPATLISALLELSSLSAVTAADVRRLPPGAATLTLSRARLGHAGHDAAPLLEVLSLAASWPQELLPVLLSSLGLPPSAAETIALRLEGLGLVVRDAGLLLLADAGLRSAIAHGMSDLHKRELASKLLASPLIAKLDVTRRARLAIIAHDEARMLEWLPDAAAKLTAASAQAASAELLEALLACASGALRRQVLLDLASARHALGADEIAVQLTTELANDDRASVGERSDASMVGARALTALGRFDDAIDLLGALPSTLDAARRARVQRELTKLHLRLGDYGAVEVAALAGLACAPETDAVRVELLCSLGMVASYRGKHDEARISHEEALRMARAHGDKRDEANALTYLGIGYQRCGDMVSARDYLAQSLEIARTLDDVGNMATFSMNLGAVLFHLGEPAAAAEHYESAARLARRAGRVSTQLQARNNLAHIHIYFGLYERARIEVADVRAEAERTGHKYIAAQATVLLADLLSRIGEVEEALINYDDAIVRYTKLGQTREIAEHHLDAAEALLDRGGAADGSAAAARLSMAREEIERDQLEDHRLRMDLLVARARVDSGDSDGAVQVLNDVVARARTAHDRDIEWSAYAALSRAHENLGAGFASRRNARSAVEVLEEIALRIPREHREAFWHDPRRRTVRERATEIEQGSLHTAHEPSDSQSASLDASTERQRLLEIIKRLASEHELDRLLERITESAVDLSGAERGFVLLVADNGALMPHVTRARKSGEADAHAAFSRSIAEAVLIDGEPIVTVDASADGRLREYVSVHKLVLRSVACLPIRGHSGTVGVLYLEHRRSRGRFSDSAVDLLCAFADQAAIAIENTRLVSEIRRQKDELEAKNRELAEAKEHLEDTLLSRTRQLDDVQRELLRATRDRGGVPRHGMVGRSATMLRVFDAIDRLASTSVSVVIRGESGTGKELVARAIHYAGPRAKAPFVALNCGSLPESLLESELFGHVKGAFSGADRDKRGLIATASGGTLFLDEVADMPPKMQVDLLRVLQEGKVSRLGSELEETIDIRVLTASARPLSELVAAGKFREDLFYRLSVVELVLPSLRDRRDDIPLLAEHFLHTFVPREGMPKRHLTRAALARLVEEPWPGNVRQLEHVLMQASVMAEGSTIDVADLGLRDTSERASSAPPLVIQDASSITRIECLDHHKLVEKQRILDALEACGWNRVRAAQTLGMPRRTFYRRLADYSIL